jgi:lauroyl/myristoyl acyltransferase
MGATARHRLFQGGPRAAEQVTDEAIRMLSANFQRCYPTLKDNGFDALLRAIDGTARSDRPRKPAP